MKRFLLAGVLGLTAVMAQKQPQPKSQKEVEAINAMIQAQDPDARIKAADYLITKFADTDFKSLAMFLTAESYERKGDFEKMTVWCEKTLDLDPKNYSCMLMLGGGLAKRSRENDLDLNEKLDRSDKYTKSALETLKDAPKPNPQITDDQWASIKKDYISQAHEAYGAAAMLRKKYDVAISEYKQAVEGAGTPDPATMVRLGQAYNAAGKPDDAIAILDKVMADSSVHPQIRQVAQAERVRAIQAKGGGAKPAATPPTPGAPAAAEPKK
jgi:tetratricopeptide (TPR) repeat protein